jgi:hypothetical protein
MALLLQLLFQSRELLLRLFDLPLSLQAHFLRSLGIFHEARARLR